MAPNQSVSQTTPLNLASDAYKFEDSRQFIGRGLVIKDSQDVIVASVALKTMTLKTDIKVFAGQDKTQPLYTIQQKSLINLFKATEYVITDVRTNTPLLFIEAGGLENLLNIAGGARHVQVLNYQRQEIGQIVPSQNVLNTLGSIVGSTTTDFYDLVLANTKICNFTVFSNVAGAGSGHVDFTPNQPPESKVIGLLVAILMLATQPKSQSNSS